MVKSYGLRSHSAPSSPCRVTRSQRAYSTTPTRKQTCRPKPKAANTISPKKQHLAPSQGTSSSKQEGSHVIATKLQSSKICANDVLTPDKGMLPQKQSTPKALSEKISVLVEGSTPAEMTSDETQFTLGDKKKISCSKEVTVYVELTPSSQRSTPPRDLKESSSDDPATHSKSSPTMKLSTCEVTDKLITETDQRTSNDRPPGEVGTLRNKEISQGDPIVLLEKVCQELVSEEKLHKASNPQTIDFKDLLMIPEEADGNADVERKGNEINEQPISVSTPPEELKGSSSENSPTDSKSCPTVKLSTCEVTDKLVTERDQGTSHDRPGEVGTLRNKEISQGDPIVLLEKVCPELVSEEKLHKASNPQTIDFKELLMIPEEADGNADMERKGNDSNEQAISVSTPPGELKGSSSENTATHGKSSPRMKLSTCEVTDKLVTERDQGTSHDRPGEVGTLRNKEISQGDPIVLLEKVCPELVSEEKLHKPSNPQTVDFKELPMILEEADGNADIMERKGNDSNEQPISACTPPGELKGSSSENTATHGKSSPTMKLSTCEVTDKLVTETDQGTRHDRPPGEVGTLRNKEISQGDPIVLLEKVCQELVSEEKLHKASNPQTVDFKELPKIPEEADGNADIMERKGNNINEQPIVSTPPEELKGSSSENSPTDSKSCPTMKLSTCEDTDQLITETDQRTSHDGPPVEVEILRNEEISQGVAIVLPKKVCQELVSEEKLHRASNPQIINFKELPKRPEEADGNADNVERRGNNIIAQPICVHKVIGGIDLVKVIGPADCDVSSTSDMHSNDKNMSHILDKADVVSCDSAGPLTRIKLDPYDDVEQKLEALFEGHNFGIDSPKDKSSFNGSSSLSGILESSFGVHSPDLGTPDLSNQFQNTSSERAARVHNSQPESTTAVDHSQTITEKMAPLSGKSVILAQLEDTPEVIGTNSDSNELIEYLELSAAHSSTKKSTNNASNFPPTNATFPSKPSSSKATYVAEQFNKAVADAFSAIDDLLQESSNSSNCEKKSSSPAKRPLKGKEICKRKELFSQGTSTHQAARCSKARNTPNTDDDDVKTRVGAHRRKENSAPRVILSVKKKDRVTSSPDALRKRTSSQRVGGLSKRRKVSRDEPTSSDEEYCGTSPKKVLRKSIFVRAPVIEDTALIPIAIPNTFISQPKTISVTLIGLSPKVDGLLRKDSKDLLKGFCWSGCKRLTVFSNQMWKNDEASNIITPHCKHCLKTEGEAKPTEIGFWFCATVQPVGTKSTMEVIFSSKFGAKFLGCTNAIYISNATERQRVHQKLMDLLIKKTPFDLRYIVVKVNDDKHFRAA